MSTEGEESQQDKERYLKRKMKERNIDARSSGRSLYPIHKSSFLRPSQSARKSHKDLKVDTSDFTSFDDSEEEEYNEKKDCGESADTSLDSPEDHHVVDPRPINAAKELGQVPSTCGIAKNDKNLHENEAKVTKRKTIRRKIRSEEKSIEGKLKIDVQNGRPMGPHRETFVQRIRELVRSNLDIWRPKIKDCPQVQIDSIHSALEINYQCDYSNKYFNTKLSKTFRAVKKNVFDSILKARDDGKAPCKPLWMKDEIWTKMQETLDSKEYKVLQQRNKDNRSKQKNITNVGRCGYVGLKEELEKELGRTPSCNEVFIKAHTSKGCGNSTKGELSSYAQDVVKATQAFKGISQSSKQSIYDFGKIKEGHISSIGLGMSLPIKDKSKFVRKVDLEALVFDIKKQLEDDMEARFKERLENEVQRQVDEQVNRALASILKMQPSLQSSMQPTDGGQDGSQVLSSSCTNTSKRAKALHNDDVTCTTQYSYHPSNSLSQPTNNEGFNVELNLQRKMFNLRDITKIEEI